MTWGGASAIRLPNDTEIRAAISAETVGRKLYPQTAAESTAGVTPSNYVYPPGDVRRYGAALDDATDDLTAVQNAIDATAGTGDVVFVPEGSMRISAAMRMRSDSAITGAGMDRTVIKLTETADEDVNMVEPFANDSSIIDWAVRDLTLHGNAARAAVTGRGSQRPGSSCVATMGSHYVHIERVRCIDAVLHGIDVCNGGEDVAGDLQYTDPASHDGTYYPSNMSKYVWVRDCESSGAGDDQFTAHYSQYVWLERCVARDASSRDTDYDIKIGVELDDGVLDAWVTDCFAARCARGFAAKAHALQPAASRVHFSGNTAEECHTGLWLQHSDGDHDDSLMGEVTVNGLIVRKPLRFGLSTLDFIGVAISTYPKVTLSNIVIDADGSTETLNEPIKMSGNAKEIVINGFEIFGWDPDGSTGAVDMTSATIEDIIVSNGYALNSGKHVIRLGGNSADNVVTVSNVIGRLDAAITDSSGIRFTTGFVDRNNVSVQGCFFPGYDFHTSTVGTSAHSLTQATDINTQDIYARGLILSAASFETNANLADVSHAINTTGKYVNKLMIDSTNNKLCYAVGSSASSNWQPLDGSAAISPV